MSSKDTFFARLYLPHAGGIREVLIMKYVQDLDCYRSIDGTICRVFPWSSPSDYHLSQSSTGRERFIDLVNHSISESKKGLLKKVVLSRVELIERKKDPENIVHELAESHRHGLVYHLKHPLFGEWMGATPELLFSRNGNEFETMALAGTLPAKSAQAWSTKLLEEHHYVVEDLLDAFRKQGVVNARKTGPNERLAGTIKHLETRFTFQSTASDDVWRQQLHPTSAICGSPKKLATQWISQNESHERRLYCGLIGIEWTDRSAYYVNLRCAQVFDTHYELFAGVGLTESSDPKEEWEETERKLDTIRSAVE
jgi:isochorismate synthase